MGKGKKSASMMVVMPAKSKKEVDGIRDDSMPTDKEREMMRQMERDRKMDEGTAKGVAPYEREMEIRGYKKGGAVSRGNGCAIRGTKKCKMY